MSIAQSRLEDMRNYMHEVQTKAEFNTLYAVAANTNSVTVNGINSAFTRTETIAANGSLCGVGDLDAIAEASQWINRYVLDSISTGVSIAFAMECYENGILTKDDTDGIDLTWGNADAVIQMIHKMF